MNPELEMIRYDRVRHINVCISKVRFLNEHVHGSFEINYVLEGGVQYHHDGEVTVLQQGSLVIANPNEPHSFATVDEVPAVLLTLQIHKLFERRYVESIPRLIFDNKSPADQHDELIKLLLQTAIAYFGDSCSKQFNVVGYAMLLLGKMVSDLEWKLDADADNTNNSLQQSRAQRLADFIDMNYRQKLTLSMLAEMEGISTTYLSHFFRKAFGVSFQDYLRMQRFEKALVLMRDETLSMVDICMNCGFSDPRYLDAACQKTFGCSVAQYRKQYHAYNENAFAQDTDALYKRYSRKQSLDIIRKHLGEAAFKALC